MHSGKTVFKQLLQFLPRYEFNLCVRRYRGELRVKKFSTYDQFLCLAYAQMSGRESLRDMTWSRKNGQDVKPLSVFSADASLQILGG